MVYIPNYYFLRIINPVYSHINHCVSWKGWEMEGRGKDIVFGIIWLILALLFTLFLLTALN